MAAVKEVRIPTGGEVVLYSTSTVLASGAVFNTPFAGTFKRDTVAADQWIPRGNIGEIIVTAESDKASATNGIEVEESSDASQIETTSQATSTLNVGYTLTQAITYPYFRLSYTNSAALQGRFSLKVIGRIKRA